MNFTQTLAMEWAPKVRVNRVTAGMMRTEQSHLFYGDEAGIAAVGTTVPLGRLGLPADVGDACLFLASPLGAMSAARTSSPTAAASAHRSSTSPRSDSRR